MILKNDDEAWTAGAGMDERTDEGKTTGKEEWLATAWQFFHDGDFNGMRACAREILSHDMDDVDGQALFAQASLYLGEEETAENIVRRLWDAAPGHWRLLLVAGEIHALRFEMRKAIDVLKRLWALGQARMGEVAPYDMAIMERAGRILTDACYLLARPDEAAEYLFELVGLLADPQTKEELYSKALFLSNYRSEGQQNRARREGINGFFGAKVTMPHTRPSSVPDRKMRIGYISPDLREHAVANFLSPFFRNFAKLDFNVFCYMTGTSDNITQRFKRSAVNWRDLQGLSPQEAARRIYRDHVDVLVDFAGHSQGSSLATLAYRPAPIQMTAIGDVGSTGLREIDYFLTDGYCSPPDRPSPEFTEQLARLAGCHLCYDPSILRPLPEPGVEPPAQRNGFVTFGSFNNFAKASRETLVLWRSVLEAVPRSRLLIKGKIASVPDGEEEVKARLANVGVDLARVDLRPYSPDYLEQYRDVDVALDTTPFTGGLTTCEALVMGVPVISLKGSTHAARIGASILENAGLPELVAANGMEYVKKAARIAGSLQILVKFHGGLREVVRGSRLMDAKGYMKNVEALYRSLWEKYCTAKDRPTAAEGSKARQYFHGI